jgi:hypothetical protein
MLIDTSVRPGPSTIPVQALCVSNTGRGFDVQSAQDLLDRTFDSVQC